MVELVLREPCEHGRADDLIHAQSTVPGGCPGGRETVLDPEHRFAMSWKSSLPGEEHFLRMRRFTVQDVIDALTKEGAE